jgi:hypothetical protein
MTDDGNGWQVIWAFMQLGTLWLVIHWINQFLAWREKKRWQRFIDQHRRHA